MARSVRKPMEMELPTGDEAKERWNSLVQRLDALDRSVAELLELGQLILMALKEAAAAGVPSNVLLDLVGRVIGAAREAGAYYRSGKDGRS